MEEYVDCCVYVYYVEVLGFGVCELVVYCEDVDD